MKTLIDYLNIFYDSLERIKESIEGGSNSEDAYSSVQIMKNIGNHQLRENGICIKAIMEVYRLVISPYQ